MTFSFKPIESERSIRDIGSTLWCHLIANAPGTVLGFTQSPFHEDMVIQRGEANLTANCCNVLVPPDQARMFAQMCLLHGRLCEEKLKSLVDRGLSTNGVDFDARSIPRIDQIQTIYDFALDILHTKLGFVIEPNGVEPKEAYDLNADHPVWGRYRTRTQHDEQIRKAREIIASVVTIDYRIDVKRENTLEGDGTLRQQPHIDVYIAIGADDEMSFYTACVRKFVENDIDVTLWMKED